MTKLRALAEQIVANLSRLPVVQTAQDQADIVERLLSLHLEDRESKPDRDCYTTDAFQKFVVKELAEIHADVHARSFPPAPVRLKKLSWDVVNGIAATNKTFDAIVRATEQVIARQLGAVMEE